MPNHSFEAFSATYPQLCNCGGLSNAWGDPYNPPLYLTPPWYSPTSGSPDCFKPCSPNPWYSVPKNLFGYQMPRTGIGYALIACRIFVPAGKNFREYLQVQLIEPLQAGKNYQIEFFVSLADCTNYAIDRIGMYISDTAIWLPYGNWGVLDFVPQISNLEFNYISDTVNWTKISGILTAQGGEEFITIGNFYDDDNTNFMLIDTSLSGAPDCAFYIDDVSVILIEDTIIPPPEPPNAVYIPNIFSPNGDGNNDVFYIRGENISGLDLKIYNRWGNLIFETNDKALGWDGKYQSKDCPEAVYFYVAEVSFANGEIVTKTGNVTIVR